MDALQALLSRVSPARLAPDEPDPLIIEQILAAGLRAADHGRLRPWNFSSCAARLASFWRIARRRAEVAQPGSRHGDVGGRAQQGAACAGDRDRDGGDPRQSQYPGNRADRVRRRCGTEHARRIACPRPWRILAHRRGRLRSPVQEGAGRLGEGHHRRLSLSWKSGDGRKGEGARSRGRGRRMERAPQSLRRHDVPLVPAGQSDPRQVLPRPWSPPRACVRLLWRRAPRRRPLLPPVRPGRRRWHRGRGFVRPPRRRTRPGIWPRGSSPPRPPWKASANRSRSSSRTSRGRWSSWPRRSRGGAQAPRPGPRAHDGGRSPLRRDREPGDGRRDHGSSAGYDDGMGSSPPRVARGSAPGPGQRLLRRRGVRVGRGAPVSTRAACRGRHPVGRVGARARPTLGRVHRRVPARHHDRVPGAGLDRRARARRRDRAAAASPRRPVCSGHGPRDASPSRSRSSRRSTSCWGNWPRRGLPCSGPKAPPCGSRGRSRVLHALAGRSSASTPLAMACCA